MTAKEFDTMVREMRRHHAKIDCRTGAEDFAYYLYYGLRSIGRDDLAKELDSLYAEMEKIETSEIVELGTFNN